MIAMTVAHMMTNPPITPPTIAPMGAEECDEGVDRLVEGMLEEPLDPPPGWFPADMLAPEAADAELTFDLTTVVPFAIGVSPGGYCVPVLIPSAPVNIGRSTAWFNPV